MAFVMTGSAAVYGWNDKAIHAINFVTVHDGLLCTTLFHMMKANGCGFSTPSAVTIPSLYGVTNRRGTQSLTKLGF